MRRPSRGVPLHVADATFPCELSTACHGRDHAVARVELSGLINPNLKLNQTTTVRHWCGDVCARCLTILEHIQSKYPLTASLRIADLAHPTPDGARMIGDGRVFRPGLTLAQLHPALINVWQRPELPPAEDESAPLTALPVPTMVESVDKEDTDDRVGEQVEGVAPVMSQALPRLRADESGHSYNALRSRRA